MLSLDSTTTNLGFHRFISRQPHVQFSHSIVKVVTFCICWDELKGAAHYTVSINQVLGYHSVQNYMIMLINSFGLFVPTIKASYMTYNMYNVIQ